jgi:hypothetical protein
MARDRAADDAKQGQSLRAQGASTRPGIRVRSRSFSEATSPSSGVSFSVGDESSGAESSPGASVANPTAADTKNGAGAAWTSSSHGSRKARPHFDTQFNLRHDRTCMSPRPPHPPAVNSQSKRDSAINLLSFRRSGHDTYCENHSCDAWRPTKRPDVHARRRASALAIGSLGW